MIKKKIFIGLILIMVFACSGCNSKDEEVKPLDIQNPQSNQLVQETVETENSETKKEKHTWVAATCTTPRTCSDCGITKGEPLGHKWEQATCTEPQKCSRCHATDGEALGHDWAEATCSLPKTCKRCKQREGTSLGHTWIPATCTESKKCSVCGKAGGAPLGHDVDYTIIENADCTKPGKQEGVCSRCGQAFTKEIPISNQHVYGEWIEVLKASCTETGSEKTTCEICGSTRTRIVQKLPHIEDEKYEILIPATSKEPGIKVTHCKMCGEEMQTVEYDLPSDDGMPVLEDTDYFKVKGSYTYTKSGTQYLIYVVEGKRTIGAQVKLVVKESNGDVKATSEDTIHLTEGKMNFFQLKVDSLYIAPHYEYSFSTKGSSDYRNGDEEPVEVVRYNRNGKYLYITVRQTKDNIGSFSKMKLLFFNGNELVKADDYYYSVYADELANKGDEAVMAINVYKVSYDRIDFFNEDR